MKYRQMIPIVDPRHPEAWGRDDLTGLPVMHNDMIMQMEYIGSGLQWTGFMVHYKDADQPNPQLIPPRLKPDPVPIDNPRYLQFPELPAIPSNLAVSATTSTSITVTWDIVPGILAYSVQWNSIYVTGTESGVATNTYTITNLTPGNTYLVSVASIGDNTSTLTAEFTTSAFSNPVSTTLPNT